MEGLILAINIAKYEDIVSNICDVCACAVSNKNILDVVVFLPKLDQKMVDTVYKLSEVISSSGYSGRTHFFVDEEDKSIIPFDYWVYFKEVFPAVSVCSKEDVREIGDVVFQSFMCDSFYSDELDDFIGILYDKAFNGNGKFCFAVNSNKDKNILNKISNKFICLENGEVKLFNSNKNISNIKSSNYVIETNKNGIVFNDEKDAMFIVESGPVLKKNQDSTKKKGRKR